MSRALVFRITRIVTVLLAAGVAAFSLVTDAPHELAVAGFFAVLIALASLLRIEAGEGSIGFEAPVVFGAIVILHDASLTGIAAFAGALAYWTYRAFAQRRFTFEMLAASAQLAVTYFVVALLYSSAVLKTAAPMAKVSGYILLLLGYVFVHVGITWLRRWSEGEHASVDLRRMLLTHGRAVLLLSPVVAIEVLLFNAYQLTGVAVAFLPVLLVAYAMRNEIDAALQNTELVRRNRELSILTESSTQILSAEDDQETLRRLMSLLSKLAKMKACAVVTWEANPDVPATVYRFGECLPNDQEILRWVDSAGFAQSAPSRAFVFRDEQRRFPLSGGAALQVLIGIQTPEVIYGILIFETEDLSILKAGSLNLLTLLVNQTALSLQDQLLRREMREKTTQLETQAATTSTILGVATSLIGSFDIDGALTRIAHAIRTALGFEIVVFGLYDAKRGDYVRRAHAGLDDGWEELRKKRVDASEINEFFNADFRISNAYFISHARLRQAEHDFVVVADDRLAKSDEWHENDMLIVPLTAAEQIIGYLSVRDPNDRHVPSLEKVQTLEIFAAQAVTALQSSRYVEEIKRLTHIDALTPAFNHRYFQEALAKEIHRHSRNGHEFAVAILDIDNFKRINDTFGHPVGDEILKGLVEELMTNARDTDVVARYGGEEFAIIFPDTPAQFARDAANRFRDLVESREFAIPSFNRTLHITVSVGVAAYPRNGVNSADLIARADEALYFAKKNGKNRVAVAGDVLETGNLAL
jgi:diguanylate cyclase (GGDEF)-like protein